MHFNLRYIHIKVIIGLVLWRAYDHLKVINLFLFYRSANDFVNRRYVDPLSSLRCTAILPYYFQFIIYAHAPTLR